MEHQTVLRLEHTKCKTSPGHGPYMTSGCTKWRRPNFGTAGTAPDSYEPWEQCGVTREQLGDWWSIWGESGVDGHMSSRKHYGRSGWYFVEYSVPLEEMREDNNQIVFCARPEYRVRNVPWSEIDRPIPKRLKSNSIRHQTVLRRQS